MKAELTAARQEIASKHESAAKLIVAEQEARATERLKLEEAAAAQVEVARKERAVLCKKVPSII